MSHKKYMMHGEEKRDFLCDNKQVLCSSACGVLPDTAGFLFEVYMQAFIKNWHLSFCNNHPKMIVGYESMSNEASELLLNRAFDALFDFTTEKGNG